MTAAVINPLEAKIANIDLMLESLHAKKRELDTELAWHLSVDRKKLSNEVDVHQSAASEIDQTLKATQSRIQEFTHESRSLRSRMGSRLNPKNWFDSDERQKRQLLRRIRKDICHAEGECREAQSMIKTRTEKISDLQSAIVKFDEFDRDHARTEAEALAHDIKMNTREKDRLKERRSYVESKLSPLRKESLELGERREHAVDALRIAESLERRLSNAPNSYERAMAHEACERQFDIGSPKKVAAKQERVIRQIDRDLEKLTTRAQALAKKHGRQIDTIIIDGNNLCYESNAFIGLAALDALVYAIKSRFNIVVVFDSGIRRLVKSNDKQLQEWFGSDVKVHVVATSAAADETVLDLAGEDKNAYVLSNDRFADFREKGAVRHRRVIRHEIVCGKILVHDLDIRLDYT